MARVPVNPDHDPEADELLGSALTPRQRQAHTSDGKPRPNRASSADPTDAYSVTADELRQFVERWEQLDREKKDITAQQKELMDEAKGRGYDTKVMRKVIMERRRSADELAEENAILEMYREALGMA